MYTVFSPLTVLSETSEVLTPSVLYVSTTHCSKDKVPTSSTIGPVCVLGGTGHNRYIGAVTRITIKFAEPVTALPATSLHEAIISQYLWVQLQ